MSFVETYGKELFSLLVPLVTALVGLAFKAKAKLSVSHPHQFAFLVDQPMRDDEGNEMSPTQTVRTRQHIVTNSGRETATRVEMVFNWKPMCINLWPLRHHEEHILPDRRYVLIFDSLAPGETIGVELLSVNSDLPNLANVRSAECVAREIELLPQPVVSNAMKRLALTLMVLGLAAAVYLTILLLQFLLVQTPLGAGH